MECCFALPHHAAAHHILRRAPAAPAAAALRAFSALHLPPRTRCRII